MCRPPKESASDSGRRWTGQKCNEVKLEKFEMEMELDFSAPCLLISQVGFSVNEIKLKKNIELKGDWEE